MIGPHFTQTHLIDYSMVDSEYNLKLSALLRFMQNGATAHYETLGVGRMKLISEGFVFLLSKIALKVQKMPKADQTVKLTTWEYGIKGAYFVRNFAFSTEDCENAVIAQTLWVAANPETHSIVRPSDFPHPVNSNPTEVDVSAGKVSERGYETQRVETRAVRYSDIDCNGHVNNTVYADVCADILFNHTGKVDVCEFAINYNRECKMGDELTITLSKSSTDETDFVISGDFKDGTNSFKARIS